MSKTKEPEIIPIHQWTNGEDRVLMLRYVSMDHKSYGDYRWPSVVGSEIEAPDWNPEPACGGGFHGWPWGIGIGAGKEPVFIDTLWQVISADPKDVIWLSDKAKCRKVRLEFVGSWWQAIALIESGRTAWIQHNASGAASATGVSGAASATGVSGAASATGWRGAASATGASGAASATGASGAASATGVSGAASATGESGAASATGWSGAASATGWRGAASATGWSGAASATGWSGAASATGWSGAASATGWRGAASATGESGAASATGWRGAAITCGEYSTVECGKDGIAVSTADEVTWVARPGAVFVHRYGRSLKIATFKGTKAVDGEHITFNCGKIIKREKP